MRPENPATCPAPVPPVISSAPFWAGSATLAVNVPTLCGPPIGAGKVTEAYFRVGEYVNAGQPVLALLPPANVLARFFVPQAELATLALGQAVSLQCDGCGAPLAARISRIATAPEYTPPVIYSTAQKARLVFMLEARPEAADAARLRPGQPLLVRMPVQQAVK